MVGRLLSFLKWPGRKLAKSPGGVFFHILSAVNDFVRPFLFRWIFLEQKTTHDTLHGNMRGGMMFFFGVGKFVCLFFSR